MGFQWDFNGISMAFQCDFNEVSMGFQLGFNGISMGFQWDNGISMGFQWDFHGISMGFQWGFNEISMRFPWDSNGISMGVASGVPRSRSRHTKFSDKRPPAHEVCSAFPRSAVGMCCPPTVLGRMAA